MDLWSSSTAKWRKQTPLGLCLLIVAGSVAFQAFALLAMGHPLICECGYVALWHGNPADPETSQQLVDWYTYTHVIHGCGFYLLLRLVAPRMSVGLRFALTIGLEGTWEIIENTPFVIDRYRQSALARGYFGDSVVNSVFDTIATALGFVLARILPAWSTIALVIAIELFLGYMIRDNLTLNILQLVYPTEAISNWQMGQ
jgi:hypothetical protein